MKGRGGGVFVISCYLSNNYCLFFGRIKVLIDDGLLLFNEIFSLNWSKNNIVWNINLKNLIVEVGSFILFVWIFFLMGDIN